VQVDAADVRLVLSYVTPCLREILIADSTRDPLLDGGHPRLTVLRCVLGILGFEARFVGRDRVMRVFEIHGIAEADRLMADVAQALGVVTLPATGAARAVGAVWAIGLTYCGWIDEIVSEHGYSPFSRRTLESRVK